MNNKKPAVILGILVVAVAIAALAWVVGSWWLSPRIRVENRSGEVVRDLRLVLQIGDTEGREEIEVLGIGDSREFAKRCSDLYVWRIEFRIGETAFVHPQTGLATTGETWVLMIQPDGSVLTELRSRY